MTQQLSPWARKVVTLKRVRELEKAERQRDRLVTACAPLLQSGKTNAMYAMDVAYVRVVLGRVLEEMRR